MSEPEVLCEESSAELGWWAEALFKVVEMTQSKSITVDIQLPTGTYDVTITKRE